MSKSPGFAPAIANLLICTDCEPAGATIVPLAA
jgi:hypothetical protein